MLERVLDRLRLGHWDAVYATGRPSERKALRNISHTAVYRAVYRERDFR